MKTRRPVWMVVLAILVAVGVYTAHSAQVTRVPPRPQETVEIAIRAALGSGTAIPVHVAVGSSFSITLESNPTTGYSWRLAGTPAAGVLKSAGSRYAAPESTGRVGQGGVETWEFRAVGRGKATVTLEYARPWEKGIPPIKKQAFAVVVY